MPTTPLLPLPDGLEIIAVSTTEQELQIRVISHRVSSICPRCSKPSQAIHSYYRRKPTNWSRIFARWSRSGKWPFWDASSKKHKRAAFLNWAVWQPESLAIMMRCMAHLKLPTVMDRQRLKSIGSN